MRRSPWRGVKCSAWRGPYQASRRPLGAAWTPTPLGSVRRLLLPRGKGGRSSGSAEPRRACGVPEVCLACELQRCTAHPKVPRSVMKGTGAATSACAPDKPQLLAELRRVLRPGGQVGSSDLAFGPVRVAPRRARAAGWLIRMAPQNDRAAEPVAGGPSGGVGPLLGVVGAPVHNIDAVPSPVGKGKTEPEGHHDDGGNPQDVEREPDQTQDQGDAQHADHHGVWALFLAEYPRKSFVQPRLRGRSS